jgi:hypothetical protein
MLAPVLVPMLMLLGVSPEMTTAAFRMGDSVTNPITPLMVYFPLVLAFCQRWIPQFGMGTLIAAMLPYSLAFLVSGLADRAWVFLTCRSGPAPVGYSLPVAAPSAQVVLDDRLRNFGYLKSPAWSLARRRSRAPACDRSPRSSLARRAALRAALRGIACEWRGNAPSESHPAMLRQTRRPHQPARVRSAFGSMSPRSGRGASIS